MALVAANGHDKSDGSGGRRTLRPRQWATSCTTRPLAPVTHDPVLVTYDPVLVTYDPALVTYAPVLVSHAPVLVSHAPAPGDGGLVLADL
ncbi:MAG TPA: hypothetical protein VH008_30515 [Pseudonocardia sp.]|nr:hypothetical protein [Pseudonocardia sp.]